MGGMRSGLLWQVACVCSVSGLAPFSGVKDREMPLLSTELGRSDSPASISQPFKKRRTDTAAFPGIVYEPFMPSVIERVNMEIGNR